MDNPLIYSSVHEKGLTEQMASFGDYIAARRKALKLTQKDVASHLKKEDGIPISLSYFHDIEAGKRNPPNDQLIEQLAAILGVPAELLYFQAERMPADFKREGIPEERILAAYEAFRRELDAAEGKKKKRS
jgi:transcriptional regulator with XRE-family HTH domain